MNLKNNPKNIFIYKANTVECALTDIIAYREYYNGIFVDPCKFPIKAMRTIFFNIHVRSMMY